MGTYQSPPSTPLWRTPHKYNCEIHTREKHDIRVKFERGATSRELQESYNLGQSTVRKVLNYSNPTRKRPLRIGPKQLLSDAEVDEIKAFCAESWEHRTMTYKKLKEALGLQCSVKTLGRRLNQRGFFR